LTSYYPIFHDSYHWGERVNSPVVFWCLQVSNLSTIRQVDYSLSAEQLAGATVSGGPLRHQVPAANHVTVATVTHDVIRSTPPPAYESLFPTESNNLE